MAGIWSSPFPGPCPEPFPDGFPFIHVAVVQRQGLQHLGTGVTRGAGSASSARAAQWGAGCCPAPACTAARDYPGSCSSQGPTAVT